MHLLCDNEKAMLGILMSIFNFHEYLMVLYITRCLIKSIQMINAILNPNRERHLVRVVRHLELELVRGRGFPAIEQLINLII